MIEFLREGSLIKVKVKTTVLGGHWWAPVIECNSEPYASLLRQHMHEDLNHKLEAIRREAYLKGWKDAKAKVKKETWFSGWW